jgi:hypothetical protein
MIRRRRRDIDAQALRLMRILGELDVWNDAHDGASHWYRIVQASYRRGLLSRPEWMAYRASYAATKHAKGSPEPRPDTTPAPASRRESRVA